MIQRSDAPPNAEATLTDLGDGLVRSDRFYVRCNFPVPELDVASWRLETVGAFDHPRSWTLDELRALPHVERVVTLECAGNGRTLMAPIPAGIPWGLGAVGAARFGGVRLADVLAASGLRTSAADLVFTGADRGNVESDGEIAYAFNLDTATASSGGPMLAWKMGDEPLTPPHGFPLRLVVPDHYAMRSVKWLTRITAVEQPFAGHFPRKYRYRGQADVVEGTPVGLIRVRSLFTAPDDGAHVPAGPVALSGIAWSGHGPIQRVEVEVGAGRWLPARVGEPLEGTGPVRWSIDWTPPAAGTHLLAVRAADAAGHQQPKASIWNAGGYGNNVIHRISVEVE